MGKGLGTLDVLLTGAMGAKAVLDGLDGQYVPLSGEIVAAAGLGYAAYEEFAFDKDASKGLLFAAGGLCAAGATRIIYSIVEQKPLNTITGILDLVFAGALYLVYRGGTAEAKPPTEKERRRRGIFSRSAARDRKYGGTIDDFTEL